VLINTNELLGKTLGTCILKRLVGRGGMGAVYLAQQVRPRRTVAVKVLVPNLIEHSSHDEFLARFRREADAIAALDHVNIMPVYEYGEQGEVAYIVMPYITGGTLRERLIAKPILPAHEVLQTVEQAAAGLDSAHSVGIVHRDLKPGNILFHADGRLLLADFGLAKVLGEVAEQEGGNIHTNTGTIVGTPEYLSPEQGIGTTIDYRSDVYSLGVVLYQMLAGRVPFVGATAVAVAIKHAIEVPPLLTQFNPAIPAEVEAVVMKALAKSPNQRYSSAGELAQALRTAIMHGNPHFSQRPPEPINAPMSVPDAQVLHPPRPVERKNPPQNVVRIRKQSFNADVSMPPPREPIQPAPPVQQNSNQQDKVAALPTLLIGQEIQPSEHKQVEDAFPSPTLKEDLQAIPTLVTSEENIQKNPPLVTPEKDVQAIPTLVTTIDNIEAFKQQPKDVTKNRKQGEDYSTAIPTKKTSENIQVLSDRGAGVQIPGVQQQVRTLPQETSQRQPLLLMLVGLVLAFLLIGGGFFVYQHTPQTNPIITPAQATQTVLVTKGQATQQQTATNIGGTPTSKPTTEPFTPPRASIQAGALIYGTLRPFTTCDQQGGQWKIDISGVQIACLSDGSQVTNNQNHLSLVTLDSLTNSHTWPTSKFIVQVDASINQGYFGMLFNEHVGDNAQGYYGYTIDKNGSGFNGYYDASGNQKDSYPRGQKIIQTSKITLDIRVDPSYGNAYHIYINGQDSRDEAGTGAQNNDKTVGLAVGPGANITFSNFAIYALP
jgi:serine/threonine protein kinase